MKDLIVLIAGIMLGLFIFDLVAGDENSLKSTLRDVWVESLNNRAYVRMVDEQ